VPAAPAARDRAAARRQAGARRRAWAAGPRAETIPGLQAENAAHLYNAASFYNLAIARGTLTEEERYKINDHIVQTIVMLNRLPFPKPPESGGAASRNGPAIAIEAA